MRKRDDVREGQREREARRTKGMSEEAGRMIWDHVLYLSLQIPHLWKTRLGSLILPLEK